MKEFRWTAVAIACFFALLAFCAYRICVNEESVEAQGLMSVLVFGPLIFMHLLSAVLSSYIMEKASKESRHDYKRYSLEEKKAADRLRQPATITMYLITTIVSGTTLLYTLNFINNDKVWLSFLFAVSVVVYIALIFADIDRILRHRVVQK